ncbi:Tfp pilus assembly protein PilX [Bradyrhizobium sp. i1.4.4]
MRFVMAILVLLTFQSEQALACDELISNAIKTYASPAFADLDCNVLGQAGLDKKGHTINNVCYESSGPMSHVRVDTTLNCHASDESVVSKLLGSKNGPSFSENVSVDADIKGADCTVLNLKVSVSGEVGKAIAALFGADEKGGKALGDFLKQVCNR